MPCLQCPISLMQLFGRNSVWKELPYLLLLGETSQENGQSALALAFNTSFRVYSILVADILPWNPICIKSVWANSLFQAWKVLWCKQAKNCKPVMSKQDFQEHRKWMDIACTFLSARSSPASQHWKSSAWPATVFFCSSATCEKMGLVTAIVSNEVHAFLVEPPAPNRAKMTVTKTTIITTLAVSPWRVPTPRSQYQWMPTLGGSPAKAGNGTAAAAAAAATAVGTCVLLEMNAGTQAQMARRASRATLSSCDPLRAIITTQMFL